MIGRAREWDGLYYLEAPSQLTMTKGRLPHSFISEFVSSNKKILLHHYQLGHPSFSIIKIMFPSLFKSLDVENLHREVCELVKHKHVPFPISNKVLFLSILFTVIFAIHLLFLMFLGEDGLCLLLMIVLVLLGFFCENISLMLVPCFQISVP